MQRSCAAVLTAALVLATSVSVMAQPPGGGRGGRGFGGGMFGGSSFLLGMESVQKELAITDAQKEKISKMQEEARAAFQGGGANLRDMSDEERAKFRTQMEERAKKTEETVKSILDEKQYARLQQLSIQQAGVMALSRPDVAEKLKLTDDQKSKIREVAGAGGGRGAGGGFNPNATDEERRKAREEATARREKLNADVLAVLTAEQKKSFEEMQGKKFEFPAFGGFGGPGGGNRPGGGRPQRDAN